jgi:hypothetical protein
MNTVKFDNESVLLKSVDISARREIYLRRNSLSDDENVIIVIIFRVHNKKSDSRVCSTKQKTEEGKNQIPIVVCHPKFA